MSKRLLFLVAFCSLLLPLTASAQHAQPIDPVRGRIFGIVVGAAGPLIAADVAVRNAADSVVVKVATAEDGRFLIENLAFGRYTLRISFLGFKTRNIEGVVLSEAAPVADLGTVTLDASLIAHKTEAIGKK